MHYPKIPQNSLADRIKTIINICETLEESYGEDAFVFQDAITDDEIESWEKENQIKIPGSYKEWLSFSKKARIEGNTANFYEPKEFITDNSKKPYDVPDECIVIGELGGWGISLCFSSKTGKIMYFDHGEQCIVSNFGDILEWLIFMLEE